MLKIVLASLFFAVALVVSDVPASSMKEPRHLEHLSDVKAHHHAKLQGFRNDSTFFVPEHRMFEHYDEEDNDENIGVNVEGSTVDNTTIDGLNENWRQTKHFESTPVEDAPVKSKRIYFNALHPPRHQKLICQAAVGLYGTCHTVRSCRILGGTIYGSCPGRYGVCCIVRRTCGSVTGINQTYFANPDYPSTSLTSGGECSITVTRPSRPLICQIRLDFHEFQLAAPVAGDCVADRLIVTGQSPNSVVPPLCGYNSGQHVYFDIDQGRTPFQISIMTTGQGQRRWDISITMIECGSISKAPHNCLQYYQGGRGIFHSFNYRPDLPPGMSGGYLNNQNYAVCFRKEFGACTQTYFANSTRGSFDLMNVNDNNAPTLGSAEAGLGLAECPNDYVVLGSLRYCGTRLNPSPSPSNPTNDAPVLDGTTGPLIAQVVTNSMVNGIGFQLSFLQNACTRPQNIQPTFFNSIYGK